MNKENHKTIVEIPYNRAYISAIGSVENFLISTVGNENYDWWIKENYNDQCSYVVFTVFKDLYEKVDKAMKSHGVFK